MTTQTPTVDGTARPAGGDDAIHCICNPQVPPGRPAHWHENQDCPALLLTDMETKEVAPPQVNAQPTVQQMAGQTVSDLYPAAQQTTPAMPGAGIVGPQTAAAPHTAPTTAANPPAVRQTAQPPAAGSPPGGWVRAQNTPQPEYNGVRLVFADVECLPTPEPNPETGRVTLKVRRIALKLIEGRWVENQPHPKYGPPKTSHSYVADCEILPQGPAYADYEGLTASIWCSQAALHTAMPLIPLGTTFMIERGPDIGQRKTFEFYWPEGVTGPF